MFSILRKGLLYHDLSTDVVEHDEEFDAEEYVYGNKRVYRGTFDPKYIEQGLKVYSLYDDNSKRVGIVEQDSENDVDYEVLWFYENSFSTLLQEPNWVNTEKTIWSIMTDEAYQDCLEDDFKTVFDKMLSGNVRLITAEMILQKPSYYRCDVCKKCSLHQLPCATVKKQPLFYDFLNFKSIFIDDRFVVFEPPKDSQITWLLSSSCEVAQAQTQSPVTETLLLPSPSPQSVVEPTLQETSQ